MQNVRGVFPSFFRPAAVALACSLAAAAVPADASAQAIYKWVDERGVVNYGNAEVPKDREVKAVDTAPKVALRSEPGPGSGAANAKPNDTELLRQELARTREEVSRLRQNVAAVNSGAAKARRASYAEWREDCERQRRVDCNEGAYAASESEAGVLRQAVIQRRPHPAPKHVLVAPKKELRVLESAKPPKAAIKPLASLQ